MSYISNLFDITILKTPVRDNINMYYLICICPNGLGLTKLECIIRRHKDKSRGNLFKKVSIIASGKTLVVHSKSTLSLH